MSPRRLDSGLTVPDLLDSRYTDLFSLPEEAPASRGMVSGPECAAPERAAGQIGPLAFHEDRKRSCPILTRFPRLS